MDLEKYDNHEWKLWILLFNFHDQQRLDNCHDKDEPSPRESFSLDLENMDTLMKFIESQL